MSIREELTELKMELISSLHRETGFHNTINKAVNPVFDKILSIVERDKCSSKPSLSDKWVSVGDRLPENNKQVMIYSEEWGITFAIMQNGKFWDGNCYSDSEFVENVTNWMPLPQPPSEAGEQRELHKQEPEA